MKKVFVLMNLSAVMGMVPAQAAGTEGEVLVIASGEKSMWLKNGSDMNGGFFRGSRSIPGLDL